MSCFFVFIFLSIIAIKKVKTIVYKLVKNHLKMDSIPPLLR